MFAEDRLKLSTFNNFKEMQLSNIYCIPITEDVSKLLKSNDINKEEL